MKLITQIIFCTNIISQTKIKRKLKSLFLDLLNIPIDQGNEHVARGWTTVSKSLVAQYYKVGLLIMVSAVAAIFEGATMALLGLAISTFVHGDSSWISSIPEFFNLTRSAK